jgi:hypothetical protein
MYRLTAALAARLRSDRGEFGPMAYAVMVSAMVILALAVAAWGEDIANAFMDQIDAPGGAGGGDGGGGTGGE